MKNPNSPINKLKRLLNDRWSGADYPGGEKRFQVMLFGKDFAIFVLLPVFAVILFKSCEMAASAPKKATVSRSNSSGQVVFEGAKSQIIDFRGRATGSGFKYLKKAPGTLVKVRLLNNVETYSAAPVHAQIIDSNLGQSLFGGTMIGEAAPDQNIGRINIVFTYVKDPKRAGVAIPITARALSLDGTFGVNAKKKGNVFARSAVASVPHLGQPLQDKTDSKGIFLRALSQGFMDHGAGDLQTQLNRLQVLTVNANTEFFVELTDFFPGSQR